MASTSFVVEVGYVHMLTGMSSSGKGARKPSVKCGKDLLLRKMDEHGGDWTGWNCDVTCPECLAFYDKDQNE